MDSLYQLRTTAYGCRGLFALQPIPKDTLLHICPTPYASVIYRTFRKEVCGHCFAYAFEFNRNAWNVKYDAQAGNGVWFCGEMCRDLWAAEQNFGGFQATMNAAVDRLDKSMKKNKMVPTPAPQSRALGSEHITLESIDLAWKLAEEAKIGPGHIQLDEMELDTARFVISAIIKRYGEDTLQAPAKNPLSWSKLLQLQNNEVMHVRTRPHILDSHLRIYKFLRRIIHPILHEYVKSSETVRAVLARDQGNVFGLWDMSTSGDSEMLGWSMYVSASYFNHGIDRLVDRTDCSPNVRKARSGRALHFYTTREVPTGEELCINYVEVHDPVKERREQLSRNWYFDCACKRCEAELAPATPTDLGSRMLG
ncbi:hypothetical protein BD779DRAFT_1473090 [Infundibulicybe gibba]|nr:hypothetical protein BD779DRAFT_1473090 [Infundibulicybe gibba]